MTDDPGESHLQGRTATIVFYDALIAWCDLEGWHIIDLGEREELEAVQLELLAIMRGTRQMTAEQQLKFGVYVREWRALNAEPPNVVA